ncbi:MAG: hypothetical protein LBU65_09090, partial [Planctomycetaceae bacterium]|nr:hypothetical protein [Planctomycetaceae bacterium]
MNYINLFSAFVVSVCQSVRQLIASIDRWVACQHSSSFPHERSRGLMIEPLESRELLAANILDFAVYASPGNDAIVTFDLSTYKNETMVFDVTAYSDGAFDPGAITILGSNGQSISPSSISTDSTTISTGRFSLSGGTYTLKVLSDNGTFGNFNLSLAVADDVESNRTTYDPTLKDLITVTLAQNSRIDWYGYLTNVYPHLIAKYGADAFKGNLLMRFPEMDMNGDGVVDNSDKELAIAVANSVNGGNVADIPLKTAVITTSKTTTPTIIDIDGPAITIALRDDTGSSQSDKLTTDPTLNVTITDPRTIKSVQVSMDDGQS